jgi:hypothetical protein
MFCNKKDNNQMMNWIEDYGIYASNRTYYFHDNCLKTVAEGADNFPMRTVDMALHLIDLIERKREYQEWKNKREKEKIQTLKDWAKKRKD